MLDLHLRRHRMGTCDGDGIRFDWAGMGARGLHLIPAYEMDSKSVYASVLESRVPASFYGDDCEAGPLPSPDDEDFFVEVESAVACLADPEDELVYLNFYSEEAYLWVTEERALQVFDARPGELLAQSLLYCVADGSLRMRRHRHGIPIFEAAARHHVELQRRLGRDEPGFPPWR
ncbi:MAG TPA: hypothetical protein VF782_04955 [Allosphingosinicella sp.]